LTVTKDMTRVMNRIKSVYRSWAIACAGTSVYTRRHRGEWLAARSLLLGITPVERHT
jgi:hypothetical protein